MVLHSLLTSPPQIKWDKRTDALMQNKILINQKGNYLKTVRTTLEDYTLLIVFA